MNNSEGHNKYEELKKRRYLRIGVISFTIIIATLWIMSIRLSFVKSPDETSAREPLISKSFKADVRNIISLDKNDLTATEINQKYFSPEEKSFLEDMAKDLESKELETPNDRLRAAEEKMIVDFNDRISEKNKKNCPEYINCMPRVGGTVDCTIPSGCENITQIAY